MKDSENPKFLYSLTDTTLLLQVANGTIDPLELAKLELVARGLGKSGEWVGFDQAKKEWEEAAQ